MADEPTRRKRKPRVSTRRRAVPLPTAEDKPLLRPEHGPWFVYLLVSNASAAPYIGKTNDLTRRLREHNGELAGGAARTHRAAAVTPWTRALHVRGFPDERAALNFEWRWQYDARRAAGADRRAGRCPLDRGVRALAAVLTRDRPTSVALPFASYGGVVVVPETPAAAAAVAAVTVPPPHCVLAAEEEQEAVIDLTDEM